MFTRVPIFCLLNASKDWLIILPKLPFLPKSDLQTFLTIQLHVHHSHSVHHRHWHSTFFQLLATLLLSSLLPVCLQPILSFQPKSSKNLPFHSPSPTFVNFFHKSLEDPPTLFRTSPTHPLPSLPPSHQFIYIPLHYLQPPSFLIHTAHPSSNRSPMHFSCSSYGDVIATRRLINQT
jgi:hypothetical protein